MKSEQERLSDAQKLHLKREEEFNKNRREHEESMRYTGRTTRLIDHYVQKLFKDGEVILRDHHAEGTNSSANAYLADKFEERMSREHEEVTVKYNDRGAAVTAIIIKG